MKDSAASLTVITALLAFCVLVQSLPAQDPADQPLKDFLVQAARVRDLGPACSSCLRTKAREEVGLAQVIVTLRRQALAQKTAGATLSAEKIAKTSNTWIGKARVLLRMGDPILRGIERVKRRAAPQDRELLESLASALHVQGVKQFLSPFLGRGTYPGMFGPLKPRGESALDALLFIFLDRREGALMRAFAAEGVAELCAPERREKVRRTISPVLEDASEGEGIKQSAMILLARLGDPGPLRRVVRSQEAVIRAELKKPHAQRNYPLLIQSWETNCNLLQRSGALREAAEANTDYLRLLLSLCRYETQNEAARAGIARQCYDFACILARLKRPDFALHMLEWSFNWGFTGFDWAREDGELKNLRRNPRFAAILKEWSEGKRKPGSLNWNDARFLELAGRVRPMSRATSKPTSRPASGTAEKGQDRK